jgi:hypothetical protein
MIQGVGLNKPPDDPIDPSPINNAIDVNINTLLQWNCSDPDGDNLTYYVYFEANDSNPDELVSKNQSESFYDHPVPMEYNTIYYWQIIARDSIGASTLGPIWHFTTVENNPPDKPIIDGPISGNTGVSYSYSFNSTDPEGHDVWYYVKWGDGSIEDWFGPFSSGVEVPQSHIFKNSGTYIIYAKGKDSNGAESDWAEFTVAMPRNRAIKNPFLNFFQIHPNLFPILQLLLQRLGLQ